MDLMKLIKGSKCQSCGMPMRLKGDFGTNSDGSKNEDYCTYCYQKGSFSEPNITLDQMIEKVAEIMSAKMMMPKKIAFEKTREFLPSLKRWKKE